MPSFARAAGVLPGGSWRLPVLVVKSFRKAGKLATKDPEIRSRVVAHLLATMDSDPVLEKPATVAAASMSSNVDMEYVRSLQREFAAHQFAADQNRLSPRRARK